MSCDQGVQSKQHALAHVHCHKVDHHAALWYYVQTYSVELFFARKKAEKNPHSLLRRQVGTGGNVKLIKQLSCVASMLFVCV